MLILGDVYFDVVFDFNGNGYIDFIDNNGDGIFDEVFVWNYVVVYNIIIMNIVMDEVEFWYVDFSIGIVIYQFDVMNFDQVIIMVNQNFCVSIGDFVWNDYDYDGVQDIGEFGVFGVIVNFLDVIGSFL